jgi:hypothetical protein
MGWGWDGGKWGNGVFLGLDPKLFSKCYFENNILKYFGVWSIFFPISPFSPISKRLQFFINTS